MIDDRCLGPGIDRSRIASDATVSGASYLTGLRTTVAAGAVVTDSRLHDAQIDTGAAVIDSVFLAEGQPHTHKCDAAGRTVVSGADQPHVGPGAQIRGCTLINASVGDRSQVTDTWGQDCRIGPDNIVTEAKLVLVASGDNVRIAGPTEVSEAWLGHNTTIDKRGYYEGIFSNKFLRLRFDPSSRRLKVIGTIDLPHVSRYGINTINSTNSGKLLPQPEGVLTGLGPPRGLWRDELLSHEQVELGPCCWVAPWTKVIGQSPKPHQSDEDLVNDELTTYVMPFAVAGVGGNLTRGLVAPGELSVGLGPKEKIGAWVFTYAPAAVIEMVARLHAALAPDRKSVADTIVAEALATALAMTEAAAARHKVDLSIPADRQRPGWGRRLATDCALINAHLQAGLWQFEGGRPTGWHEGDGRWTHPNIDELLAVAPDALDGQVSEQNILAADDPVPPARVALPAGKLAGTGGQVEIHPDAKIAEGVVIGLGCRIGPGAVVSAGAEIWNSTVDQCDIGPDARIERCMIAGGSIQRGAVLRSSVLKDSSIGAGSTVDAAAVTKSCIAPGSTVSAFADLSEVTSEQATILGGVIRGAEIGTYLMSMHMAGACSHLKVRPTAVRMDDQEVLVPAIPMLGGGSLIRGTSEAPVEMECCFIGSNATIEHGCHVGFGCFVLGVLGPEAGLPPFTVSTGPDPAKHQIGGVLGSLAGTIITHFVNWTYQAVGQAGAAAAGEIVRQSIQRGISAIECELAGRSGGPSNDCEQLHSRYKSLGDYSDAQLQAGLRNYSRALASGAWEMAWRGDQLVFTSDRGRWLEKRGGAFWKVNK